MESTHWAKIRRVTPWLLPEGDPPEREYVVPPESMIDITQSMALHPVRRLRLLVPVDGGRPGVHRARGARQGLPVRRRPARRADQREALRPRAGPARHLRLHALLLVHRRLPEGRRADGPDHAAAPPRRPRHEIDDDNNGHRHELAFTKIIEKKGTLDESLLLQESYAPGHQGEADSHPGGDQGPASARCRPPSGASAPARCARSRS